MEHEYPTRIEYSATMAGVLGCTLNQTGYRNKFVSVSCLICRYKVYFLRFLTRTTATTITTTTAATIRRTFNISGSLLPHILTEKLVKVKDAWRTYFTDELHPEHPEQACPELVQSSSAVTAQREAAASHLSLYSFADSFA